MSAFALMSRIRSSNRLPAQAKTHPEIIAVWIDNVLPCTVGSHSASVTNCLIDYLLGIRVPRYIIREALAKSKSQFTFDVAHVEFLAASVPYVQPPNSIGPTRRKNLHEIKLDATFLDGEFFKAEMAGDEAAMIRIAEILLQALEEWANERTGRGERNDAITREIMSNARNIGRIVQPYGPKDPPPPGPDGRVPTFRIVRPPPRPPRGRR